VSWMFIDANLPPSVAESALVAGQRAGIPIAADAVSVQKASRIAALRFDLVFCNVEEAAVLLGGKPVPPDESAVELVGLGHKAAVVTHGSNGASWANARESGQCRAIDTVHGDVTGAGDSLIAGTLAGLCNGDALARAVALGTRLAAQALNRVGASHSAPEIPASRHPDATTKKERT
jgi:sugar/nucleoside kinase (ribokinase family)